MSKATQRTARVKSEFIFYFRISQLSKICLVHLLVSEAAQSRYVTPAFKFLIKILKLSRRPSRSPKYAGLGHFAYRTVKKFTTIYNARAQLFFCSFNLLFGDVLIALPSRFA